MYYSFFLFIYFNYFNYLYNCYWYVSLRETWQVLDSHGPYTIWRSFKIWTWLVEVSGLQKETRFFFLTVRSRFFDFFKGADFEFILVLKKTGGKLKHFQKPLLNSLTDF